MAEPVALGMPKRISHSQLTSYMSCGEQYRLIRRRGLPDNYSWALAGGSAFHSWTELFDNGIPLEPAAFVQFLDEQVASALKDERNVLFNEGDIKPTGRASKEWPNKRDRAWWEHHGPIFAQQYVDWRSAGDNDLLPTEAVPDKDFLVEYEVNGELGGIEVKGFIDRLILDSPFGHPVILDIKTGKEPATSLQLATYAKLASKALGIEINHGAFYLAEKGELSAIQDLSRYSLAHIDSMYDDARRGIEAGVYPPNPNAFCTTCPVKMYCRLYGNTPPEGVPLNEGAIV